MDMKGTIDRFRGEFAVVELPDKTMINVEKTSLGTGLTIGDKIYLTVSGKWVMDKQSTDEARKRIRKLMDDLFV